MEKKMTIEKETTKKKKTSSSEKENVVLKGQQRKPHAFDAYVGLRIRTRRVLKNISQEQLGSKLGITFQQIQKYEKGINRISAGRLYEIASFLEVPVSYFFEGLDKPNVDLSVQENRSSYTAHPSAEDGELYQRLLDVIVQMKNPDALKRVLKVAQQEAF
jgi:transcriptional regulator with XRE-family HTH domain